MKSARSASVGLFVFALVAFFLTGCSERKEAEALETDANGYLCDKCGLKFYTDREVFAGICPACKPGTPFQVVGYVCEKDKHVTIAPRGKGGVCEQCKGAVDAIKLPHAAELQAWGAVKKTKAEVSPK